MEGAVGTRPESWFMNHQARCAVLQTGAASVGLCKLCNLFVHSPGPLRDYHNLIFHGKTTAPVAAMSSLNLSAPAEARCTGRSICCKASHDSALAATEAAETSCNYISRMELVLELLFIRQLEHLANELREKGVLDQKIFEYLLRPVSKYVPLFPNMTPHRHRPNLCPHI